MGLWENVIDMKSILLAPARPPFTDLGRSSVDHARDGSSEVTLPASGSVL